MELSIAKVQSVPGPGFIKATKRARSSYSQIVRHCNTVSDVAVFKNHLGILVELTFVLSFPPRESDSADLGWDPGIRVVITSAPGFANPKSHLVARSVNFLHAELAQRAEVAA